MPAGPPRRTSNTHTVERALRALRAPGDRTTLCTAGQWWRATWTPVGPGTIRIRWDLLGAISDVATWGPGADWLARQVPLLTGQRDLPPLITPRHRAVGEALRNHPGLRLGGSGDLYHELLPTILGQRITGREAAQQWRRLVAAAGQPAPGPHPLLRLPPSPRALLALRSWDYHRLGIEQARVRALRAVAAAASRLWDWAQLPAASCAAQLATLDRVGQWTIGVVGRLARADPDALAVGDYHLKNQVCWALAGQPRGTDAQMLDLLSPYLGQRGRVAELLAADGWRAPAFGPRRRILPMAAW